MTGTIGPDGNVVLSSLGVPEHGPPPQSPDDPKIWQVRLQAQYKHSSSQQHYPYPACPPNAAWRHPFGGVQGFAKPSLMAFVPFCNCFLGKLYF